MSLMMGALIQRSIYVLSTKHVVYILECKDQTYYTGYTNRLPYRMKQHQAGKGAKYTKGRGPLTLRYATSFDTKTLALQEEYRIKQLTRRQKEELIKKGGTIDVDTKQL